MQQTAEQIDAAHRLLQKTWVKPKKMWTSQVAISPDESFLATQSKLYRVSVTGSALIQVQGMQNENAYLEISRHGDPEGGWLRVSEGVHIEVTGEFYVVNTSEFDNIVLAVFPK